MKKSLWLFAICLGLNSFCAWAQDDDVYFVPSSKDKTEEVEESYDMAPSSYTPITDDERFAESDWAKGRGNGKWDVDAYNRRGKHYKGGCNDSLKKEKSCYDQGYEDGYADGRYTSRIVRFYSPRPGIYVSSPYYLDFYDICYDPWYYGYASPWSWSWGWSGWYGWGSWYGWRPYYSWHSGWYDPWWGWHGSWYDPWWGPSYGWYPHYGQGSHWIPANAQRGPVGGYVAYGGRRGSNGSYSSGRRGSYSSRPSSAFGTGRREGWRGNALGTSGHRPSRSFGNSNRPSRSYGNSNRTNSNHYNNDRPSRSFDSNRSMQRSNFNQPSRGSFDRGSSFGGGRSGGGRSFGGGGRGRR